MWSARSVSIVITTTFGAADEAANAAETQGSRLAVTRTARDRKEIIGWQNYIPATARNCTILRTEYASLKRVKAARILIVFVLVAVSFGAGQAQKKATQPEVFLITIDTLRADHVHCYGYESIQTPALDALAKDGIRFTQAFTPSPITNTSHISILTGLLPSFAWRHGFCRASGAHPSDAGGVVEEEWLSYGRIHRRSHSR